MWDIISRTASSGFVWNVLAKLSQSTSGLGGGSSCRDEVEVTARRAESRDMEVWDRSVRTEIFVSNSSSRFVISL